VSALSVCQCTDSSLLNDLSGSVRFWVSVDEQPVGASIGRQTLHYRYQPLRSDDDPLETYLQNATEIDAAVRRRFAAGAREPVMLRDADVRAVTG
jgi:hypothetical protein